MINLTPLIGHRKRVVLTVLIYFAASMIASSLLAIPTKAQAPVLNGTETQITTDPAEQTDPAISGNYIVYTDSRNGNQDIYLYDITDREETNLTPGTPNDQFLEDIDGVRVVYASATSTGVDIYLHDISTGLAMPLNTAGTNISPSIDGDFVVWVASEAGASKVVLANMATRTTTRLTSAPSVSRPRVDGDFVVWAELVGSWGQIRSYKISSGELLTITSNSASHADPDVSGSRVVWTSNENGNWDIYLYDLVTGVTTQLTYNTADQSYPRIDGNNVIWEDTRSGTHQIWFMNLDEGLEMPVSPTGHMQFLNAIDGNHIAWTESRYGNNDIFMFTFTVGPPIDTTPPTTTITLSGTIGERGWYKSDITVTLAATDDMSGVANTYISLDNGATWQPYTSPVAVTTEGLNSIKYYSIDNQGNTETTKYAFALIDKTPPTLTILEPLPGDYYNFETINMIILANDQPEESGFWEISAYLDSMWVPINETIDLSPLSSGTHTLTVTAIDQPGWTATRQVTFNIIAITTTIDVNKQLNRDTRNDMGNGRLVSKTTIVNTGNPLIKIEDYEQFPDSFTLQKIIVKIFDPSNPAYKYEISLPYYTVQYGTHSVTITINFPTTATLSYQNPDGTWTTQQITLNTLPTTWGAQFQTILAPPSELIPGTYSTTATITAWTAPNTYTIEIATATLAIQEKKPPP